MEAEILDNLCMFLLIIMHVFHGCVFTRCGKTAVHLRRGLDISYRKGSPDAPRHAVPQPGPEWGRISQHGFSRQRRLRRQASCVTGRQPAGGKMRNRIVAEIAKVSGGADKFFP